MPSSVYEKTLGAYCSANPNDDTLDEKYDCRILQDVLPGDGQYRDRQDNRFFGFVISRQKGYAVQQIFCRFPH
jgi:hypothetical protein